jgi:hypothetical protein
MCLQYCHVKQWLLDNDEPCATCDRAPHMRPSTGPCPTCRHLRAIIRIRIRRQDLPEPVYRIDPPWQITKTTVHTTPTIEFHTIYLSTPPPDAKPDGSVVLSWTLPSVMSVDPVTISPEPYIVHTDTNTTLSWTLSQVEWGWCALTSWKLPPIMTCCHHNADILTGPVSWATVPLAPWHAATITTARDRVAWLTLRGWQETDPDRHRDRDFARPNYYGVPSTQWDQIDDGTRPDVAMIHAMVVQVFHGHPIDPSLIPILRAFAAELNNPDLDRMVEVIVRYAKVPSQP